MSFISDHPVASAAILLAAFALADGAEGATEIYGVVFVVVALSVIVQGATIPAVARRLGVPMRLRDEAPSDDAPRPPGGA